MLPCKYLVWNSLIDVSINGLVSWFVGSLGQWISVISYPVSVKGKVPLRLMRGSTSRYSHLTVELYGADCQLHILARRDKSRHFLWQRKRTLSYFCRTVILKFYFDLTEHLNAMTLYLKSYEHFLEHRLTCWKKFSYCKINMVVHIASFYLKISVNGV